MQGLERRGADLGLTATEIEQALSLGRPLQELAWYEGGDLRGRSQGAAKELFESERVLEYQCYDERWQTQGRAVIALQDWEDSDRCLFLGLHGPASDGYYQYYVDKEMGAQNGLYHICDCDAIRCKVKKARGDQRELIHIDRWRLQTPLTMLESPYLKDLGIQLGEKALSQAAREKKATPPRVGSGLDQALLEGAGLEGVAPEPLPDGEVRKRKDRSRSPARGAVSMARYLTQQVAKEGESKAREKKKKKEGDKKKKEKKRRRALAPLRRRASPRVFNLPQPGGASCGGPPKRNPGSSPS
jgi:hypothetical protein